MRVCILCKGKDEGEGADWVKVGDDTWAHWDCYEKQQYEAQKSKNLS